MKFPDKKDMTAKDILFYVCVVLLGLLALNIVLRLLPPAIFLFLILAPPIFVLADAQEKSTGRYTGDLRPVHQRFRSGRLSAGARISPPFHCRNCGGVIEDKFCNCRWCGEKGRSASRKMPGLPRRS